MVVQSTSLCNLDCSYCYLPDRQKKRVFDLDLLPLLMQRILESPYAGPEFSLVWHAGEPLTLPTSWYDEATAILYRSLDQFNAQGLDFTQHVQTNATLINDAWCECFRRNRIVVGISVDGPEDIHDAHRRFRNGRGSHAMAMKGIEALHRNDVPFHCISVVTADAMEQPERMYRFFRDNGISEVGFNVEEQEGIHTTSSMQGSAMEEKYRDFLRAFWRLSEQDGHPVVLREFEQVISLIQGNARMTQNELNRPFSILSVDWQGNFSTFDPELLSVASDRYGSFNLGNLKDLSLVESTYTAPEQLTGPAKANSIEARIEAVRNTDWGSLLKDPEIEDELAAKSKWKNGKGKKFGNSYGKGKWGNGKSGNKWGNSRRTWGNGGYGGGWRNGGGGWKNGGCGFVNW